MVRTLRSRATDTETGESVGLDELPSLDRGRPLCECDHGDDEAYEACGRRAKWRVSIDCTCGEDHPRAVEILCSRCLNTLRRSHGPESLTVRRL